MARAERKEYLREYQRAWISKRRERWLTSNGPCVKCGSWIRLELDHVDPETKVHHCIWSWSEKRRNEEIQKCQVLCFDCHLAKTTAENKERAITNPDPRTKYVIAGKMHCRKCDSHLPVDRFHKDRHMAAGYYTVCKDCRRSYSGRVKN